jgi:plasmid stabilization system protein ParE
MFRSAVLAEEASCDIDGATSWHESQSGAALANAFLDDVLNVIDRIERFPGMHTPVHRGARRAYLRRFPYTLLYQTRRDRIEILRCLHLHSDPRLWRLRVT